jgi:hypothetical protein
MSSNDGAQTSNITNAITNRYKAELICKPPPAEVVPGTFTVFPVPGHTLEQHSTAIKMDITPYILRDLTKLFKEEQVVYAGQGIGDNLWKMIRADEGVQFVECDYYAHMASEL